MTTKELLLKQKTTFFSLRRLNADKMLGFWRRRNARKLKGLDAVKAIRELRNSVYR